MLPVSISFSPVKCQKPVSLMMARFDAIHPIISGNKWYKLYYYLQLCEQSKHKTLLTFGGAWSNHLLATSYACKLRHLTSIGIVRGEQPAALSPTLQQCREYGMQLFFADRQTYKFLQQPDSISTITKQFGDCLIVPEGGYGTQGAAGAALMMKPLAYQQATHFCLAVGTATTLAGILQSALPNQQVIAVPVVSNLVDIDERLRFLNGVSAYSNLKVWPQYHFGGYAKKTDELMHFMDAFNRDNNIPLDFVYTAKLMYGVMDMIEQNYFPAGSRIICLHTGGLQGNRSLKANEV